GRRDEGLGRLLAPELRVDPVPLLEEHRGIAIRGPGAVEPAVDDARADLTRDRRHLRRLGSAARTAGLDVGGQIHLRPATLLDQQPELPRSLGEMLAEGGSEVCSCAHTTNITPA